MTQLEENNIKTQLSLLDDYIRDKSMIDYYISIKADNLLKELKKDYKDQMGDDLYNNLYGFLNIIKDKDKWYIINKQVEQYQIKNDIRMQTIGTLKMVGK